MENETNNNHTKKCPFCCKDVPEEAKKCQYCGEWLIDKKELRKENKIFKVFSSICFVVFVVVLLLFCLGNGTVSEETQGGILFLSILGVIAYYIYFLPTVIATNKKHINTTSIFLINLIFGFTVIGWIIALILALVNEENKQLT